VVSSRGYQSYWRGESAEKENSQSLVPLLGLDRKTIFPVPCRRTGSICLDFPFYRTGFEEFGRIGNGKSASRQQLIGH
jgi:hypothetical protein